MTNAKRRVGVFGGSFNPPHIGHLILASEACWQLNLEKVLFMPALDPPHKRIDEVKSADRVRMVGAAVAGDARFQVSTLELERDLRYTVDTVAALHGELDDVDLCFLAGSDSLLALPTWREPERLLSLCRFAVALRPDDNEDDVAAAANAWGDAVTVLDNIRVSVSSSQLRARLRRGYPVRYLVPEAVLELIEREGWYGRR